MDVITTVANAFEGEDPSCISFVTLPWGSFSSVWCFPLDAWWQFSAMYESWKHEMQPIWQNITVAVTTDSQPKHKDLPSRPLKENVKDVRPTTLPQCHRRPIENRSENKDVK